jgi:hypothetical protein
LSVESQWRLMSPKVILLTGDDDDGQKFGLATPIDAPTELRQHIEGHTVRSFTVDKASSDLILQFDNELRLEILNLSSGFESWVLNSKGLIVVGRNGGG